MPSSPQPDPATPEQEIEAVYRLYAAFSNEMDAEAGAGGKLLCAGEADAPALRLLRAANIAGAASLAASAEAAKLRRAMREGAIDFVVTSLDEALRILKNEVRKKQPVAVGVSVALQPLLREMSERGVQPDLLAAEVAAMPETAAFRNRGARAIEAQTLAPEARFHVLPVPSDWKRPVADFDALLLDCLSADDWMDRRWVRLAARYLPAECRRLRSVACDPALLGQLLGEVEQG